MTATSGTAPFSFQLRPDLDLLPEAAREHEIKLHTSFASDAHNQRYYGLQDVGLIRISADLREQTIIPIPDAYRAKNFHSTRYALVNGEPRLLLSANDHEQVLVMTLTGEVDFTLGRPTLPPYADPETAYQPTDALLVGERLYVADGYGANYVAVLDIQTRQWVDIFGGHTENRHENGRFRTVHGLALTPDGQALICVDRWNSRLQIHGLDGAFHASHHLPYNAWLCNCDILEWQGRTLGVIACLYDVDEAKESPAPIYVIDMADYSLVSTICPKADLGVERAQRLHNAVWHVHDERLYIICHSWNPGKFMILEQVQA